MKTHIIIKIIILIIVVFFWYKNKSKVYEKAPTDFVMLESKTKSTDYLPIVDKNWLKETELKYANKKWESYPNEYTEQGDILYDNVYKYWKEEIPYSEFLNKLTKEQRIYFTLINFESQTNNGGVYQFLFNYPELTLITLEAMKSTKMDKLSADYENVLNEYFGKFETIQELKKKSQDDSKEWNRRWNLFTEGYKELESTSKIEEYFYDDNFIKAFQSKMVQFVKDNASGLMKIE